jgi:hypothetical protein
MIVEIGKSVQQGLLCPNGRQDDPLEATPPLSGTASASSQRPIEAKQNLIGSGRSSQ